MIQIENIEDFKADDIPKLLNRIDPILQKRKALMKRLNRQGKDSQLFYSGKNSKTKIPFEQFILAVSSGYMSGKAPIYNIADTESEEKNKIIEEILDKKPKEKNYQDEMKILVDYITKYNDDGSEHFELTKDALGLTSCYEVLWEDDDSEIRYKNYSPLQTVAIYDYTVDKNLIGLVRKYTVLDINSKETVMVELIDKNGTRTFSMNKDYKEITELEPDNHNWADVPVTCYESDFSVFETVVDLIDAFEQLIQNNRNTHEYNDTGCKLKVKGYSPENESLVEKTLPDGTTIMVTNPDRIAEDKFILESKVFYLQEDGDVDWISKDINDTATQNTIKTYMELITMMSCVPNITDTGFTNADNNSAIKNKYFALSQKLIELRKGFEKMYQRRWELIFGRINLKKSKDYDFRDIKVELPVNIPTNEQEEIDNILKLKDILSQETIITKLGYNYESEKNKLDSESKDNFEANMKNITNFNKGQEENEDDDNNPKNMATNDNNNDNLQNDKDNKQEE